MSSFNKSPLSIALGVALVTCALNAQAADNVKELAVTKIQESKTSQYKVDKVATHKISTDLIDTPKTITVISADLLADQGITSFSDALRNVSGVSTFGAGEGGGGNITTNDKLTIRGFSANQSIYIDGVRDLTTYSRDLFNYEKIEVSKGANSSIAGKGTSGGSVNLVTKRASTDETFNKVQVSFDNFKTKRITVDSNIALTQDTAVRINAALSDGGDKLGNGVENYKNTGLSLSLASNLSDKTSIVGGVMLIKQDNTPLLGLPYVAEGVAKAFPNLTEGAIDKSLWSNYYGVEKRDFEKTNVTQATVKIDHEFSDTTRLVSTSRFVKSDRKSTISRPIFKNTRETIDGKRVYTYFDVVQADYVQAADEANSLIVTQLDFITQLSLAGMKHDLVVGTEAYKESYEYYRLDNNMVLSSDTLDLNNPAQNLTYTGAITRVGDKPAKTEGTGIAVYLLDTIKINENWLLSAGVRFEKFNAKGSVYKDKYNHSHPAPPLPRHDYHVVDGSEAKDSFVSYNGSIAYKPNENTNFYLGYSNSQTPSVSTLKFSSTDSVNGLDPETAKTLELGAKWELMNDKILVNAAVFQTTKTVRDRNDERIYFLAGEQQVTGLELSISGEITDDLSLIASYTHQNSEVTKDYTVDSVGNGLSSTPKNTANMWLTYAANDKLLVGGGVTYNSGNIYWRRNSAYFTTGNVTLLNAMASYEISNNLTLQLNINNLTDTEYVTDYSAKGHFLPGAPRNIKLGVSYAF